MNKVAADMLFALMRGLSHIPLRAHHIMSAAVAAALQRSGYRRQVIEANLAGAFPEKGEDFRKKTVREYYRNIADLLVEFVWCIGKSGSTLGRKGFITLKGKEAVLEVYDKDKGVVVLHSHSGNWECLTAAVSLFETGGRFTDSDMRTAYMALKDPFWEDITLRCRTYGKHRKDQFIDSRNILRYMVRHRKEGLIYHFLVDQYPYQAPHPIGTFLNLPTDAMMGAANLAERFGMPVIYVSNIRKARGRYELKATKICDDASATGAEEVMRQYFRLLEQDVREHPSNWLWSHKRWKNIQGLYPPKKKR